MATLISGNQHCKNCQKHPSLCYHNLHFVFTANPPRVAKIGWRWLEFFKIKTWTF